MDVTLYDLTAFLTGLMLWLTGMSVALFVFTASWTGTVLLCQMLMRRVGRENDE
jgi:hypothetical protein